MLTVATLVFATSLSTAPSARGDVRFLVPASVQSNPGTVAGTTDDLARDDAQRATWSEVDPTNIAGGRWLRPNGDLVFGGWAKSPGCATLSACMADTPPHDGNTTIISSNAATSDGEFNVEDLTPVADSTITGVGPFVWARKNQTTNPAGWSVDIEHPFGINCAPSSPALTQAFANLTIIPYPADCDGSGAWVPGDLAGVVLGPFLVVDAVNRATITAAGVIVTYTDQDWQVQGYLNFTQVPSNAQLALYYRGQNSLPASEALLLQVDRGPAAGPANWVTLVNPFLTATEDPYNTLTLNPATDLVNGAVRFRVLDATQNDETGGTFTLNWFVLQVQPVPPPGGGGTGNVVDLSCVPGLGSLSCVVALKNTQIGIAILRSSWYINGKYAGVGSNTSSRSQSFSAPVSLFAGTLNVTVSVLLSNSQAVQAGILVPYDNTWFLVFLIFLAIVVTLAFLARAAKRRATRERNREKNRRRRDERDASKGKEEALWASMFSARR